MIGDDELNFTDEEAEELAPARRPRLAPVRRHARAPEVDASVAGMFLAVIVMMLFVVLIVQYRSQLSGQAAQTAQVTQPSQSQSTRPTVQTTAQPQPEYFPAGWSYVRTDRMLDIQYATSITRIPASAKFFVNQRVVRGLHLAVAPDGHWHGWVTVTGPAMQIPMHPDFAGAKQFVEALDWSALESSSTLDTPSQEDMTTGLDVLRASEASTPRSDMALFQKKDQEQEAPPEITVQGEEAVIPTPPVQEDKKVKLPKTKWYAEGASAPSVFPRGWYYVRNNERLVFWKDPNEGRHVIPAYTPFFLSRRRLSGEYHWAVAIDGSWSGWLWADTSDLPTDPVPMHPAFEGARRFMLAATWGNE